MSSAWCRDQSCDAMQHIDIKRLGVQNWREPSWKQRDGSEIQSIERYVGMESLRRGS